MVYYGVFLPGVRDRQRGSVPESDRHLLQGLLTLSQQSSGILKGLIEGPREGSYRFWPQALAEWSEHLWGGSPGSC